MNRATRAAEYQSIAMNQAIRRVPKKPGQDLLLARNLVIQLETFVFPCLIYEKVSDLSIPSAIVSISPLLSIPHLTSHIEFHSRAVPSGVSPMWTRCVCADYVAMQVIQFACKQTVSSMQQDYAGDISS